MTFPFDFMWCNSTYGKAADCEVGSPRFKSWQVREVLILIVTIEQLTVLKISKLIQVNEV